MTIEEFIGKEAKYDEFAGTYIWGIDKDGGQQMIAEVRGWGAIQKEFQMNEDGINQAAEFQDRLGEWIADAINMKLKCVEQQK